MPEQQSIGPSKSSLKLALQFNIEQSELAALCAIFQNSLAAGIEKSLSPGMQAVLLTRLLKHSIDLKFEEKVIQPDSLPVINDSQEPALNTFKARLVRGMFLTFIEHERGLPGLVDSMAGITSVGLGAGSFKLPGSDRKVKLSELQKNYPDRTLVAQTQVGLLQKMLCPDNLNGFPNVRTGVYSLLTGCSLLPFYAAVVKMSSTEPVEDAEAVQQACIMVEERFSQQSERLHRFLAQNLFRVMFEELFNHESTVFSIFSL
ncbi:MAG: hypothetical protein CVV41_02330 [Candidatus Riflebacteria bacterium HGW-Riflebacteria-1]|jgi:hypothetical protein|nr:MAG: hypothetical protein CVV41_02330 [Candidatus Riflebacteria bacterium HGW-Riflebacteria-1]